MLAEMSGRRHGLNFRARKNMRRRKKAASGHPCWEPKRELGARAAFRHGIRFVLYDSRSTREGPLLLDLAWKGDNALPPLPGYLRDDRAATFADGLCATCPPLRARRVGYKFGCGLPASSRSWQSNGADFCSDRLFPAHQTGKFLKNHIPGARCSNKTVFDPVQHEAKIRSDLKNGKDSGLAQKSASLQHHDSRCGAGRFVRTRTESISRQLYPRAGPGQRSQKGEAARGPRFPQRGVVSRWDPKGGSGCVVEGRCIPSANFPASTALFGGKRTLAKSRRH